MPSTDGSGDLDILAYTGTLTVPAAGVSFRFDTLVTPVKPLNTPRHFQRDRYYQYGCESRLLPIATLVFLAAP